MWVGLYCRLDHADSEGNLGRCGRLILNFQGGQSDSSLAHKRYLTGEDYIAHKIVGLHHANVRLPSSTEQATRDFYGRLLGLEPDPNFKAATTVVHWCVGDTGSEVHTKWGQEPTLLKSGEVLPSHFPLLVEDLEVTKAYLSQNGVHFEEADLPGARHEIFIKDPEGNIVELQQVGAHH